MPKFRADCSKCCGLCCVVSEQMAVQGFAVDKPAGTPCVHLDQQHRCSIYGNRTGLGYAACATFDCFGVGQWVSEHLFEGADWRRSPELAREMFAAYRFWLPRFHAAALIEAALPYVRSDARTSLLTRMSELVECDTENIPVKLNEQTLYADTLTMIRNALKPGGRPDLLGPPPA